MQMTMNVMEIDHHHHLRLNILFDPTFPGNGRKLVRQLSYPLSRTCSVRNRSSGCFHHRYYEQTKHWKGLLAEPSPVEFPGILKKKRKSWAFFGGLTSKAPPDGEELTPECWNAQKIKKRRGNKPNFFEFSEVGC